MARIPDDYEYGRRRRRSRDHEDDYDDEPPPRRDPRTGIRPEEE